MSSKRGREQGNWATPRPQLAFLTITSNLRKGTFPKHRFQRTLHSPRRVSSSSYTASQPVDPACFSLAEHSTLPSVLPVNRLSQGAGAGPMSPAPSVLSHMSDCQDHFFIYRLTFSLINKPRTQREPIANSLDQQCISSLRMIAP